ncbi:MAG: ribonuclease H-like domain-containing protein [Pirellulaceae bacterium]
MLSPETLHRLRMLNRQPMPDSASPSAVRTDASYEPSPFTPDTLNSLDATQLHSFRMQPPTASEDATHTPSLNELLAIRLARLHAGQQVSSSDESTERLQPNVADEISESTTSLDDGRTITTPWGEHWLLETPLSDLWPNSTNAIAATTHQLASSPFAAAETDMPRSKTARQRWQDLCTLTTSFPRDVAFLDLETCGFAGTMVFLVGLIHPSDNGPVLSQLFARNYAEEKAMFQTMWQLIQPCRTLVTFNGKSFDWPQVHDRSTMHLLGTRSDQVEPISESPPSVSNATGIHSNDAQSFASEQMTPQSVRPEPYHIDLLHHARRRWRKRLPNCKLQTLERYVCGRNRSGDIAGRDIPVAYHEYVRTGDAWQMKTVLHHNALDLVTLVQIAMVILRTEAESA